MPTRHDSLRRARRERDEAVKRGDTDTARLLDQAIEHLIEQLDGVGDAPPAVPPADDR